MGLVTIHHNPGMRHVAQRAGDDPQLGRSSRTSSNISNARRTSAAAGRSCSPARASPSARSCARRARPITISASAIRRSPTMRCSTRSRRIRSSSIALWLSRRRACASVAPGNGSRSVAAAARPVDQGRRRARDRLSRAAHRDGLEPDCPLFERYLTIWVALWIVAGVVLGHVSRASFMRSSRWRSPGSISRWRF